MFSFLNYFSNPTKEPKAHKEPQDDILLRKVTTKISDTNKHTLPLEIKEYLSQNRNSISKVELNEALSSAAFLGNRSEIIKLLAQYNADVNSPDFCGHSPLHLAASWGYAKTCLTLLALKANPNTINNFAQTPNQYAINCAQEENQNKYTSATQNLCIELNTMAAHSDSTDLASLIAHGDAQIAILGGDANL